MGNKVNICGVNIDNVSMAESIKLCEQFIDTGKPVYVVTPNVDHIVQLQRDKELEDIYAQASLAIPDGMPLVWASKFLGTSLKEKVSGSDIFPMLCELSAHRGFRIFLLGGREDAAEQTAEIMKRKYKGLVVSGVYSPPFGFETDEKENDRIIDMIKDSDPDILFVGLGTPKQEKWIYKYYKQLNIPVSMGIGATFDFISGIVKRAPKWMQKAGLEWLWRTVMEPGRLWKRYFMQDFKFLGIFIKYYSSRTQKYEDHMLK